jgi:hypothetical protein
LEEAVLAVPVVPHAERKALTQYLVRLHRPAAAAAVLIARQLKAAAAVLAVVIVVTIQGQRAQGLLDKATTAAPAEPMAAAVVVVREAQVVMVPVTP